MKVATDLDRPALTSVYEVAGRFLLVKTSEDESARAIRQFLTRWEVRLVTDRIGPATADAEIIFRVGRSHEFKSFDKTVKLGDSAAGFSAGAAFGIQLPGGLVTADETAVVRVWLERPLRTGDIWLAQILSHSLSAALRRCGVFELHSGGVIDNKSAKAVLICGPSGSGKSTLTLQLVAHGWSYLSDDVVLLTANRDRIKASGLRRFFALTSQTVEYSGLSQVSELLSLKERSTTEKLSLRPEDLFPAGAVGHCYPDVILFPLITKRGVSIVHELPATETMSRLLRLCPWSCYDSATARGFLEILASLAKQATSFELLAGADLLGDSGYTTAFVSENLIRPVL